VYAEDFLTKANTPQMIGARALVAQNIKVSAINRRLTLRLMQRSIGSSSEDFSFATA
jgi:hypothetical protein